MLYEIETVKHEGQSTKLFSLIEKNSNAIEIYVESLDTKTLKLKEFQFVNFKEFGKI